MVDPLNPIPLYRQLADELAADIKSGTIANGQRLPSESYLEQEHGLARGTVRRAMKLLNERGLAFTIQGRGHVRRSAAEWVEHLAHPAGSDVSATRWPRLPLTSLVAVRVGEYACRCRDPSSMASMPTGSTLTTCANTGA